ncbi:MAG: recombinase family protein [Alistipes sp.]|nr:recombinase family protein [Alistipes sp.]
MPKITKIEPPSPLIKPRLRVAAYARVSRETERLMHSLSAQVSYYSDLIQRNPEWEYTGVYADSFISGTSTKKRSEFQRMISDCEKGLINVILCKSISRFARNTVDLLNAVRHLKKIGVEVRFEKENINTLSSDGEVLLTLLASFAEQESRSISENCKWGIRKRFQDGTIGTANKHILGYRYDEVFDKYVIIPEEAESVRWMFQMFLDGLSYQQIADNLTAAGVHTILGNNFQEGSIRAHIVNEVYAGDIRRQKTHTPDPISKMKIKNNGELTQYLYTDCHEAIIDRETYALVQEELKRRNALMNPTYFFTGLIKCECCGNVYTRKKSKLRGKTYVHWICRSKKETGMTCSSENFQENELLKICKRVVGEDYEDRIKSMSVDKDGNIHFTLTNGEKRVWTNLHLNPAKHPHTVTDAFLGKVICGKCSTVYHRVNAHNRWCYWKCYGKQKHICDNVNYTDYQLRTISAYILNMSQFNEDAFTEQIQEIRVLDGGSLKFIFTDGSEKIWEKL